MAPKRDEKKVDGVDSVDPVDSVDEVLVAQYDRYFTAALGGMVARFGPGNPGVLQDSAHEVALWGLKTRAARVADMASRVGQWKGEG